MPGSRGAEVPAGAASCRPRLPSCFGLASHRPLHDVGQLNVLQLVEGDEHTQIVGPEVEDHLDMTDFVVPYDKCVKLSKSSTVRVLEFRFLPASQSLEYSLCRSAFSLSSSPPPWC